MLKLLPNKFKIMKHIEKQIIQDMENDSFHYQTQFCFDKSFKTIYSIALSSKYLCFGQIEKTDIAYKSFLILSNSVKFQKIISNTESLYQVIGLKLIYSNQQLEIFIKNKNAISFLLQKLCKKLTQLGFHQQYKPLRKVGKGGFATVYEIKRFSDGKLFAAKAFSKAHVYKTAQDRLLIQNEIQILKVLDHQNLLYLYQTFQSQNSLYLVMQMYQGGDLVSLIKKNNAKFKDSQVSSFIYDLLKGLQHLNQLGIMHRDLKPDNIFIRNINQKENQLVIGDFGLASFLNIKKYLLQRCGTPGYVPPEIANYKSGQKLSTKCDIFSLGVIFHILVCRKHLFEGTQADEVYKKNKNMQFNLDDQFYNDFNQTAMSLIRRMLEKDPKQRISASQALEHQYFWQNNMIEKFDELTISNKKKLTRQTLDSARFDSVKQAIYYNHA